MKSLNVKLLRDLSSLRTQTFTIALLVICGVSVMISSWSSFESLKNARDRYYQQYRFPDIFADLVRAPNTELKKIASIYGIEHAESRIVKDGLVEVSHQSEPALGRFISWRGEGLGLNQVFLKSGRYPRASSSREVIVHEAFMQAHGLRVGQKLKVLLGGKFRQLVISGVGLSPEYVYALSPVAPLPDDKHFGVFWMRQADLEFLSGMDGAFNSVIVKKSSTASTDEIKRQINELLGPFGCLNAYDRSEQLSNLFVEDEIRQQKVAAAFIPTIFLLVAAFILNVVLSRLIALHRPQIATLKSLGYGSWSLTVHYFQLVTLMLSVGILPAFLAGAGIGRWYAGLYEKFFRFPEIDFTFSYSALFIGLGAGFIPGWAGAFTSLGQVFSLQPAEALRPPSPPVFQRGFFDRLGLTRRLDAVSKMIFRNLFFHPVRSLMNLCGLGAALAILINGSFWMDVIDYMVQRQFYEMSRADLFVQLTEPKSHRALEEIRRIPGVLSVEGQRNLAARFQFRNFSKQVSILGIPRNPILRRVLDQNGKVLSPISGGVLMSRYFESQFDLQAGDVLSFTTLERKPRQFQAPVLGFVDDMMGQLAYVSKDDLQGWLRESTASNTILLKIEEGFANKIYLALKERSYVAAVTVQNLLLKSFNETIADMVLTFTIVLIFFAGAISGAVMYNSARVSFSERLWELASLRILGFSAWRSFEILFLEVGFHWLFSILPGIWFGYGLCRLSASMIHSDTIKFPLVIEASTYGGAVIVVLLAFLGSSFYLYRKIYQLDISAALRARE